MNLKLDTALQFNINSASHANINAVLGQTSLKCFSVQLDILIIRDLCFDLFFKSKPSWGLTGVSLFTQISFSLVEISLHVEF